MRNGSMTVSTEIDVLNSLAHDLGGGVYVGRSARFEAGLRMGPATAREGGCLYVLGNLTVRGTSLFRACAASGRGGALSAQGDLKVQDMAVVGGGAPSAGIFVTLGNASVASLRVDTLRPGQAMASSLVCLGLLFLRLSKELQLSDRSKDRWRTDSSFRSTGP